MEKPNFKFFIFLGLAAYLNLIIAALAAFGVQSWVTVAAVHSGVPLGILVACLYARHAKWIERKNQSQLGD